RVASSYHLMPEKFGALAARLVEGGEVDAALELTRLLFAVVPEARVVRDAPEDEELRLPPTARGYFDTWHYRRVLEKLLPVLVDAAGFRALALCTDLLERALLIASREGEEGK